ncbi:ribosome hibernation-promoting factor, HPF/YfiA family [Paenibacillus protaetiae]|uniref:Ribosome hibernation promoting factor n=1 Tax=Paenibacillus protaetiae TaxID=2509456 RepID=A0A4V0YFI1_9BACL|nr:ribosome-associated translation inhibitor RaiA [Paenibacillus protaetiae]QAY67791.1 ribosome-associated translation inhibitor RaiA [Paenibacillus protaetiae]
MKLNIRGQHLQVTEALRDYVEKKLSRLEKYFEYADSVETVATLSVTKGKHAIEVAIPLPGFMLRAEEKSGDMYASIDMVVDKLERQIRKHKTKVNHKLRFQGSVKTLLREEGGAVRVLDEEEDFEVVRTKRHALKPMDIDEAILQMNLIGHSFFVFSNIETKQVNVVYHRHDGKYGLIEQG